jgi:hypothetical protein
MAPPHSGQMQDLADRQSFRQTKDIPHVVLQPSYAVRELTEWHCTQLLQVGVPKEIWDDDAVDEAADGRLLVELQTLRGG